MIQSGHLNISTFSDEHFNSNIELVYGGCFPGRQRGNFIFKSDEKYYATNIKSLNKKSINLRCSKATCKFTLTLKMLHICDPTIPGFYDKQNFIVRSDKLGIHTCGGYCSEFEALRAMKKVNSQTSGISSGPGLLKLEYYPTNFENPTVHF